MPVKIKMFFNNTNTPTFYNRQLNTASLGSTPSISAPTAPSALNANFIARIHSVRPGCGSCGRH
jgi:hypothetical protein